MARLLRLAIVLAYLAFLAINIALVLLMLQTLFSTLANAGDGSYVKVGSELTNKEVPARYLGFGYQGRTDFFLDYQIESGVFSHSDFSSKIKSAYVSGSLGLSTAYRGVYSKGFFGLGIDLSGSLTSNQDFELGICGDDGISAGLFIKRLSDASVLQLAPFNDFIGIKFQVPL